MLEYISAQITISILWNPISNIYQKRQLFRFFLPSQGDSFAGNDVTLIGQVATFAVGGKSGFLRGENHRGGFL